MQESACGSNGESALHFFTESIKEDALYLLDEPENSLSPLFQRESADFLSQSARFFGCQLVIATHSLFLLALPGARTYDLDAQPPQVRKCTALEHVRIYPDLLSTTLQNFKNRRHQMKLLLKAAGKLLSGFLLLLLLLFLPAGTVRYWNGWLLMGILFCPMGILGLWLLKKHPDLLQKRLNTKETEDTQKQVIFFSALMFLVGFLSAGFSFRWELWLLPRQVSLAAAVLFLLGYGLYARVLVENQWLSRTVEVQEDQKVVDTGLYRMIRHPMYTATIFMFLSMPLVLGSLLSFLTFLPYPLLIAKRIENEETVLLEGLPGYRDYTQRVKYRLFPCIW